MEGKKNNRPWIKRVLIVILAIIMIIATAIIFTIFNMVKQGNFYNPEISDISEKTNQTNLKTIEGENNYWLGSPQAKLTIVEFADFSCPYCKESFPKIRELSIKYAKDIKIIFRDYPIKEGSIDLAMGARCAGEQGLFWLMHDKLYQHQGEINKNNIINLANNIGADIEKFENCFVNKKYLQAIQKDYSDGYELGVEGTPTWFINGHRLTGDIPLNVFEEIIQSSINI